MFPNAKREGWRLPFSSYLDSRPSTILLYDIKNEKSTKCIKQKKDLEYRFKNLFEDYVLGEIDVTEYNSKVATLNAEIQSIDQTIQQSIISKTLIKNKRNKFKKFIYEIKNMKADIDKLDFIRIFITKVIVSNDDGNLKVNIIYKYEV